MSKQLETTLKIIGVLLTILGLLFGSGWLLQGFYPTPQFNYIYEGAFDQGKPEYEVAFPLNWDNTLVSNAKILIRANYTGKEYAGLTYVKIKKANGDIVDTGQKWADFSTEAGKQLIIPLSFSQLFEYAGLGRYIANFDVSKTSPDLISGQFEIYVEYAGQIIPGSEQTVTVYNTPWFHRTYFDYYEMAPGDKFIAYVEVINFGAESDFSIATCPYRIVTPSYQIDPSQVTQLPDKGWWPTRSGNLQSICGNEQQTLVHLKRGEKKTTQIELSGAATSEQGYYDFVVYVLKKLPILDYGDNWLLNWYARDGRQHSTYIVIGK